MMTAVLVPWEPDGHPRAVGSDDSHPRAVEGVTLCLMLLVVMTAVLIQELTAIFIQELTAIFVPWIARQPSLC